MTAGRRRAPAAPRALWLAAVLGAILLAPWPVSAAPAQPAEHAGPTAARPLPESSGLEVEHTEDGTLWISRPLKPYAWVQVAGEVKLTAPAYGFGAEVRCQGLDGWEVKLRLELLGEDGKVLRAVDSGYLLGDAPWSPLQGYAVTRGARRGRLLATLEGDPRNPRSTAGWAEVRGARSWPAPKVRLGGLGGGFVAAGEPLVIKARIQGAAPGAVWAARLVDAYGRMRFSWSAPARDLRRRFPPLSPGYYELQWRLASPGGAPPLLGRERFAILEAQPRPPGSPFGIDAGLSLAAREGDGEAARLAELAARVGLTTVRDRFRAGEASPGPDRFEAAVQARAAGIESRAGLAVVQVLHDLPVWMAADPEGPRAAAAPPEDLRDLYRLFLQAARELAPEVAFWEVWNEPDIRFFAGRPEEYAGVLKAAYLGVKAGNPEARVLLGGPAKPPGDGWLEDLFASGAASYYDLFNWHSYRPLSTLAADARAFGRLQRRHGVDLPQWLTETGDPAPWDLESERRQAASYVQRAVIARGSGVERVFPFYLTAYRRPGSDAYGLLNPLGRPRPALPALAAMTRLLGRAEPLGRDRRFGEGVAAWWFETGAGPVAVLWSEGGSPWPEALAGGRGADLMGDPVLPSGELAPEPVYALGVAPPEGLRPPRRPRERRRTPEELERLGVVADLRLHHPGDPPLGEPARKLPVRVAPRDRVAVEVALYNFSARPARVEVEATAPPGWRLRGGARWRVTLEPGQREVRKLRLRAGRRLDAAGRWEVRVEARAEGLDVAPAVAFLEPEP